MISRWLGIVGSVCLFAMAGVAVGAEAVSFESLDSDGDGYITQEEAASSPRLVENWKVLDEDEDGTLSRSEFAAFEPAETGEPEGAMQPEPQEGQMPSGE